MSILFCTPCYGGMLHAAHFRSCLNLKEELTLQGLEHDWLIGTNESLVTRARNEMTASFLETKHTHMFWLDADIEFTPEDVANVWNMGADIGVGCYAMKKRDQQLYAAWKDGALVKDLNQFDGPIEVDYAGTGFMLIRREVIERTYEALRDFEARAAELVSRLKVGMNSGESAILDKLLESAASSYMGPNGRVPALYMTPIHNDGFESEDYHLCRLIRDFEYSKILKDAGFKVIMNPDVRLKHWGMYAYGSSDKGKKPSI